MAVVVILVYFIITGLLRGSIREVTSIASLVGGFYFAYLYYTPFATVFAFLIKADHIRHIVGFLVLFCVVAIGVTLIGSVLRMFLKVMLLGAVDRILGGVIGGVKAVIVVSVLHFLALTFLPSGGAALADQSRMAPAVNKTAAVIAWLVPGDIKDNLAERLRELRWHWEFRNTEGGRQGRIEE